jgi:tripartite-type tricarboxylate transporter receptor subunit TctC
MKRAMLTRRCMLEASAAGIASAASTVVPQAFAQLDKKPVRIIVGFPAGGGADVTARLLAERVRFPYASTVIVENRPGASGRLAVEYVKNAEPDGSVLLLTPEGPIVLFPHSFRNLNYDPLRDLTPIAPTVKSMLAFHIGSAVPQGVQSLPEFMRWCKANPDQATFATPSAGTPHFVGFMLASAASVQMTPIHYRGGAAALLDLLGGHVPASVNPITEILPFAKSGALRILAVTGSQRSRFLPDIPTMREAGYNVAVDSWIGIFAPAKLPPETLRTLSAAIGEAATSPEMAEQLAKIGAEPTFQSPEQFAATVRADFERWGSVVKASGFVAD